MLSSRRVAGVSSLSWIVATALAIGCSPQRSDWGMGGPSGLAMPAGDVVEGDGSIEGGVASFAFSYQNCTVDHDCAHDLCVHAFPGGMCSAVCTRDVECGWNGLCVDNRCIRRCARGGFECDPFGGACAQVSGRTADFRVCTPTCEPLPPPGAPACSASVPCVRLSGVCGAGGREVAIGSPCTVDADCSGTCLTTPVDTAPWVLWTGGYCSRFARRPPDDAFVPGVSLPTGECPDGTVMFPFAGQREADATPCLVPCTADSDCRTGYACTGVGGRGDGGAIGPGACLPILP